MPVKFLFAAALLFLFSCKRNIESDFAERQVVPSSATTQETVDQATDSIAAIAPPLPPALIPFDKKLIKTATLKMEVTDFKKFNSNLLSIVNQQSGYIAQEQNSYSDYRNESSVTIKVPVQNFEELVNQLSDKASKTIERTIQTHDVTTEMIDTRSRLETKKQMRLKYLEFLRQSKNMSEVLQVQQEINSLQEEIESVSGRLNQMGHQTAYSTIHLTYISVITETPPTEEPGFAKRFITAFRSGIAVVSEFLLVLVGIWPLLLLITGLWLLYKRNTMIKV